MQTGARRGGLVYHWKHGWIPLDHFAALSKAKGSHSGAAKIMQRHGIAHESAPTRGAADGGHFRMSGAELHDRAAKGDAAASAELARRAARKNAAGGKAGGKHPGVAFRPPAKPAEPAPAESSAATSPSTDRRAFSERQSAIRDLQTKAMRDKYGFDERWSISGNHMVAPAVSLKHGDVINTHTDSEVVQLPRRTNGSLPTYGQTPRTVDRVDHVDGGVVVHFTDGTHTPTPAQAKRPGYGSVVSRRDHAVGVYQRQGSRVETPAPVQKPPVAPLSPEKAALADENARIVGDLAHFPSAGPGHNIRSSVLSNQTVHRHESPDGRTIGRVVEYRDRPGQFVALHQTGVTSRGLPKTTELGTFHSRLDAHKAVATAETVHRSREADKAAKKAETNAKKVAGLSGLPGPAGKAWEPHTVTGDGTRYGDAAAAKAQQAYRSGGVTVVIETAMTKDQTKGLLADITAIVDKAGVHQHEIKFVVPTGDRHFRAGRRGVTGAYVLQGGKTVYINPRIANNALADKFEAAGHDGQFMDVSKSVPARQYTLTHELGHVMDNINGHTFSQSSTPSGVTIRAPKDEARTLAVEHKDHLSKYGRSSNAEAYAEAYAQWVHGGPGSSPVADAYARRFGWTRPRAT